MTDRPQQGKVSFAEPTHSADSHQIGGEHYKGLGMYEHWNVVAVMGWGYFVGQITRYLWRWERKNGVEDLKKARHYLDKLIELEENKLSGAEPDPRYVNQDR